MNTAAIRAAFPSSIRTRISDDKIPICLPEISTYETVSLTLNDYLLTCFSMHLVYIPHGLSPFAT
jgi:hypothetical protein